MINVSYESRLADHVKAYKVNKIATKGYRIDRILAIVLAVNTLVLLFFCWYTNSFTLKNTLLIGFSGLMAPAILFDLVDFGRMAIKRNFKTNPKYRSLQEVSLDDEGMGYKTQNIESHIKWETFHSYVESDDLFLLYVTDRQYSIIPKDAFSAKELPKAKKLIQKKLANRVKAC